MFTTTSNLHLSCRSKKLNPFANSSQSMILASRALINKALSYRTKVTYPFLFQVTSA